MATSTRSPFKEDIPRHVDKAHPASDHYVPEPREEEVPSWKYGLPGTLIAVLIVAGIPLVAIVILFITFLAKQLSTLF